MTIKLNEGERIDDLHRNGYRIIQNPDTFCFGMDAVLLCGFAKIKRGENVLDLGTGTGIIPILLEARTQGKHFTGLEIQEASVDMAKRSVILNEIEESVDIVNGDIKEAVRIFGTASFDVVTSNPPYMTDRHGLVNPGIPKAIARHELLCTLEDVVGQASQLLNSKGRFYMVHRPFRVVEIVNCMSRLGVEPKRIRFVHPYADKEPNMVLIEGLKDGRSGVIVERPLFVYKDPGVYTDEILQLYND